jgi:hypothetical protein
MKMTMLSFGQADDWRSMPGAITSFLDKEGGWIVDKFRFNLTEIRTRPAVSSSLDPSARR